MLLGARQVGKTWLLNEFAKSEYKKHISFSLDRDRNVRKIFEEADNTEQILRNLSVLSGIEITPNDTLIVLDEIQDCPSALTALKYLTKRHKHI